jgi:hypothetical protein
MLLKADLLAEIKAGKVDTVFRRWKRATVKPGGTLMTSAGLLSIDSMEPITLEAVQLADVQRAGFASLDDFRRWLDTMKEGDLCIIRLHYSGEDPRIALRNKAELTGEELAEADAALVKLDGKAAWTDRVLGLIADHPGRLAEELAVEAGMEKAPFKAKVAKLKELGLTESLEVGYRLSLRGQAVVKERGRLNG